MKVIPYQFPILKVNYLKNQMSDQKGEVTPQYNELGLPFLRWAGGKSWLINHINSILGDVCFKNYHEPFLGGGSMFFYLKPKGKSFLSDLNRELINTYIVLRDNPNELIKELSNYSNNEQFYYNIRRLRTENAVVNASRFIYLNQTSFNGIYRVNLQGEYNVPFGFRTKKFFEPDLLWIVSRSLSDCEISCSDFADNLNHISKGDLVYLDPPYTVSHNDNGFIKYNQKLFSIEDQIRLSGFIDSLKVKGAYYILSNAHHPKILEIFNKNDRVLELERASLVGGKGAKRGIIKEYIFSNI